MLKKMRETNRRQKRMDGQGLRNGYPETGRVIKHLRWSYQR